MKELNHDLIRTLCDRRSYLRGKGYYQEGRVQKVDLVKQDAFSWFIEAMVRGTRPYRQHIVIRKDEAEFIGDCSCPVGYNCKHVAAVLLFVLDKNLLAKAANNASLVDEWLDQLGAPDQPMPVPEKKTRLVRQVNNCLLYLLEAASESGIALRVQTKKVRVLKRGGYGQAKAYLLNTYAHYHDDFLSAEDKDIARLLAGQEEDEEYDPYRYHEERSRYTLNGDLGELALHKMLLTGRCHWQDKDSKALLLDEPRDLSFHWVKAKGGQQLIPHIGPEMYGICRVDRLWYVDFENSHIGPLLCGDLSTDKVVRLLGAPIVPKKQLEDVSRRLLLDLSDYQLATPTKLHLTEICIEGEDPQFQLRLHSRQFHQESFEGRPYHCMELAFNYSDAENCAVCLKDFSSIKRSNYNEGNTIYRVERNRDAELAAIETLQRLGLILSTEHNDQFVDCAERNLLENHQGLPCLVFRPAASSATDSAERWHELLDIGLPRLQAQGWEITRDDDFQLSFAEADEWHGELEEEGSDWFALSLGVELDGEPLNLLPTLVELLRQQGSAQQLREYLEDKPYVLVLTGEHRWLKLPSERLLPIFETLVELYDQALDDDGKLRIARHQGVQLHDLFNDPGLTWHGADELQDLNQRLRDFSGIERVEPPADFNAQLRTYQQQGLNWLQFLRDYQFNGILADDMGLGKTVQTLAHLLLEKQSGRMDQPSLVIVPTSLVGNWRREIEQFAAQLKVLVLQGSERQALFGLIEEHDIVLTTYPLLHRDQEILLHQAFHYIVLDEAQYIKNPKSQTAQVAFQLKARHRLALTGTPMENHLGELWSIYHFLMPGFLNDLKRFQKLFRQPIENDADEYRQKQLNQRIAPFLLRRTKDQVLTELPEKTEIISTVTLQHKQRDLYEAVRLAMDEKVRKEVAKKGLARSQIMILDALLKLRQTCCDPRIVSLPQAKKVKQSAKLTLLMEMLPEMVAEGRKILVFSQFTKMLALIEMELKQQGIGYSKLTGQTRKRDEAIQRFQGGDVPVFLISLKAGGVGLNLTTADTVIHYDPWWNPAVEKQATDRAHRIGQKKAVFVYKLVTEGTVEEKIVALQQKKQALADAVYSGKGGKKANSISSEELSDLLGVLV